MSRNDGESTEGYFGLLANDVGAGGLGGVEDGRIEGHGRCSKELNLLQWSGRGATSTGCGRLLPVVLPPRQLRTPGAPDAGNMSMWLIGGVESSGAAIESGGIAKMTIAAERSD
jgi:hypothetical protein